MPTTAVGSIAGAALTVGLAGVAVGVAGNVTKNTSRQLKRRQPAPRRGRLRRAGIL